MADRRSADIPTTLPAVVAANTARSYTAATAHRIAAFGLDFAPIYFDGAIRAVALPTLGRSGVMVDLAPPTQDRERGAVTPNPTGRVRERRSAAPHARASRTTGHHGYSRGPGNVSKANSPALGLVRQQTLRVRRADRVITRTRSERAQQHYIRAPACLRVHRVGNGRRIASPARRAIAIELAALIGTAVTIGSVAEQSVPTRTTAHASGRRRAIRPTDRYACTSRDGISAHLRCFAAFLLVGAVANRAVARRATASRPREG